MQKIGNDKTEKLNSTFIGAEEKKQEPSAEKELREKFARELLAARERAEERILELNYAKSYRDKLRKANAAHSDDSDKPKVANIKKAPVSEENSQLQAELDEIEKRRLTTKALLLNLSNKGDEGLKPEAADEKAENEIKEENADKTEGVSQKKSEISPKSAEESKELFTKSARYKLLKPAGINIKIVPVFSHYPHFCVFAENQEIVCGEKNELTDCQDILNKPEAEDSFGEVTSGSSEELAVGGALFGAAMHHRAIRYPHFHEDSIDVGAELQEEPVPPYYVEALTDADHAVNSFQIISDANFAGQSYEGFTDGDFAAQSYEGFSETDHAVHSYPDFTDADHASHTYPDFTDADHAAQSYPDFTDADHASHSYPEFTEADHAAQSYPDFTDADHITQAYADFSDADYAAHSYHAASDAEHISPEFHKYTDADHASADFDTFTDGIGELTLDYDAGEDLDLAKTDSYDDMKAIAAYEAMHLRRSKTESRFSGDESYGADVGIFAPVGVFLGENANDAFDFAVFSKKELYRYLRESDGRVREFERAVLKTERSMKKLSADDKTRALLDTVNLNKHIVDLRAMALYALVASDETKEKKYRKRLLTDALNEYNSVLSDYEKRTGESFKKASLSIPTEIAAGESYTPLPLIGYRDEREFLLHESEEGFDFSYGGIASRRERNLDKLRFLREAEREEKRIARLAKDKSKKSDTSDKKLSDYRGKIERDLFLVKTRNEALSINAESSLDYLEYSFSAKYKDKLRERRVLKERIRRLKWEKKRALKFERLDSERYYSQLLLSPDTLGVTKRQKIDKLESLLMRLDALLSERERINEQLIKLYSGDIRGDGDGKINQNIRKIKRRTARKTARIFRREMQVIDERVPLDIKEKLTRSVNKIIDAEMLIATLRYKMRKTKPRGEARRDMKLKIRENRSAIKRYLADYRRFLKRAHQYAERARGVKFQVAWILATLAALIALAVLYIIYEAPVNAFFYKAYVYLKSIL